MKFIDLIPHICTGLPFQQGDTVLLNFWGDKEDHKILTALSENLSAQGIIPFEHDCSNAFFDQVVVNLINNDRDFPEEYLQYLASFENVIDIFMYGPSLPKGIKQEDIPKLQKFLDQLFQALTADKGHYLQLTVPTKVNAEHNAMDYEDYKNMICNALSVDFKTLKAACQERLNDVRGKQKVTIVTGGKHSLTLDLTNREWLADDGCGDLPAGEIYIAPQEQSGTGQLLAPIVNIRGKVYHDVLFTFSEGKLVDTSYPEIDDFFAPLPESFKTLCEFGIGLNPNVKELKGYTPVDEKALGTYHIALGMNHLFGGENECPFHLDIVFKADEVKYS